MYPELVREQSGESSEAFRSGTEQAEGGGGLGGQVAEGGSEEERGAEHQVESGRPGSEGHQSRDGERGQKKGRDRDDVLDSAIGRAVDLALSFEHRPVTLQHYASGDCSLTSSGLHQQGQHQRAQVLYDARRHHPRHPLCSLAHLRKQRHLLEQHEKVHRPKGGHGKHHQLRPSHIKPRHQE